MKLVILRNEFNVLDVDSDEVGGRLNISWVRFSRRPFDEYRGATDNNLKNLKISRRYLAS